MRREILNLLSATILAIGLAAAGFLAGGRYTFVNDAGAGFSRVDRFTGEESMCLPGMGCGITVRPAPQAH